MGSRRNRNLEKSEIEQHLLDALGAEKIIWAPGIAGQDITDYHIDSLARFVRPGMVAIQLPERATQGDAFHAAAFQTYKILKSATDASGQTLEIVVLPEPRNTRELDEDFVASYANFYVCNDAVLASQFGDDDTDLKAQATLEYLFPEREIVMLNTDILGIFGGGIHCVTQQKPAII